jgi:hypothetical protein
MQPDSAASKPLSRRGKALALALDDPVLGYLGITVQIHCSTEFLPGGISFCFPLVCFPWCFGYCVRKVPMAARTK